MSFFGNRRQVDTSPVPSIEPVQPTKPALSAPPLGFDTVLGTNTVLEGTLQSNANVRLDGTFTGSLEINGNVLGGETAKIKADVNARNISIAGAVRGNVSGKKVQVLLSMARSQWLVMNPHGPKMKFLPISKLPSLHWIYLLQK